MAWDDFKRFGMDSNALGLVWGDFRWFGMGSGALGWVSGWFGMIFGGLE